MQSEYARQYEELWRRHWWWQSRKRFVMGRLEKLARRRGGKGGGEGLKRILDIGCGNGLFFEELKRFGEVWGVEPDAGLVAEDGPWRERIEVRRFDAMYMPPVGGGMDLVLMLDVLEHLEDDLGAARRVREILAPGGFFLVTVPALMMLWSEHDEANLHFRRYTKARLRQVLTEAGLVVESVQYFFGWTVGPMLLRRALAPGGKKKGGTYQVNVPGGLMNGAMYAMSRAEQTTVGRWGLPVGSSLIAVARKEG